MENGEANFESKFSGLTMSDSNDGLFQVMKAVEAAEATIKQQVEENNRLKSELQKKIEELENYKSGDLESQIPHSDDRRVDHLVLGLESQIGGSGKMHINSGQDLSSTVVSRQDLMQSEMARGMHTYIENHFDNSAVNGSLKVIPGVQATSDNSGVSQFVSPSTQSVAPSRYQLERDFDSQLNVSGRGLISMADVNNSNSPKQDLVVKIREHADEIMQLKKYLAEYSVKESQIRNEKYMLEKRIAYMRTAFDQQQQDLVDAASKAIAYRQDIMEENVRLTYALQAAQQDRSMFVSSLMPLLSEYSLQPPVADAQSIVSNIKVLFRHFQEQLLLTEGKLKESQYQIAPWRSDVNTSNFSQSPSHAVGIKNGMELVPQPAYANGMISSSGPHTTTDGDLLGRQSDLGDAVAKTLEPNNFGRYSPLGSRNADSKEVHGRLAVNQNDSSPVRNNEGTTSKKVTFGDLVRNNAVDDPVIKGYENDREASANWTPKMSAYTTNADDLNSYSHLPPVLEEPTSSFSEAADDDPLPAIQGLQISGEAFPGQVLQASGFSIYGTTSCNFEWVRHLEDGSFNHIDGARQPEYRVTADDVNAYLAIEVQPLDDRKRKGEIVTVFANERRKISCDSEMQNAIQKAFSNGRITYNLSFLTGDPDTWEPATLFVKRDGYSIKCSGPSGVVVTQKFSSSTIVSIPYGCEKEFSIIDSQGTDRLLRADSPISRDTIVLTLRFFIIKAGEKKKGKKRGLFSKK
ncbi:Isochorismate synthase, chloroplastic [Olea europaea subsp. europaea]|uniref:Isochorismate synthase, chloroplastic n=1 Tax=Olea europaea subsp. europaea TaxID=158383 RepID=A0A8S0TRH4_OLEEU|nr:Isochorismate synthase, chloroplastic [Olea europaea subsp. europaea]